MWLLGAASHPALTGNFSIGFLGDFSPSLPSFRGGGNGIQGLIVATPFHVNAYFLSTAPSHLPQKDLYTVRDKLVQAQNLSC